jgi:hypothetical protein
MNCDLFERVIDQIQKECRGLLVAAFERDRTTTLIARAFVSRAHATGKAPTCKEMLEAIALGEFDFLFFDLTGQSLN